MRKGIFALLIATAFAAILLPAGVTFAAFGVSPPFLNAFHLVPGATYTQTIYLVQDNPATDLTINATLNVPASIKSWISIDKGIQFVIPAGTRQFPVNITVTVPKNQTLGSYSGNIVFATAPSPSGQVSIALGANVAVNLTVGNNIYEQYSVPYITIPSVEEGWNPRATYRFENDGNVPEGIDSATFDLYDQYDANRLDYITKSDGFPTTAPFTTSEYTIDFPTDFHLGIGDYWGVVTFYKNNEVVASQKTIFHVLPPGSLSSNIDLIFGNISSFWIYYLAALLALLLGGWRFWIARRLKRQEIPVPPPSYYE